MHILAISGSLKSSSVNSTLIHAIADIVSDRAQFTVYTGLADLPHFSPDLDVEDAPTSVKIWRDALRSADAVLICTPEYAYGMPGSLKNALDWTVSSGEFVFKPVAALSAAPNAAGGARAHSALVLTLTALSAIQVAEASLIIPAVRTKLDADGRIQDNTLKQSVALMIDALVVAATAHHSEAVS